MDKISREKRSEIMSKIHQPTRLEDTVRGWLESEGIEHEMYPKVGGKPDALLPNDGSPVYVFVDGCFWHCCPLHYRRPKSRQGFWIPHLEESNQKREDRRASLPYQWIRLWEHDVRSGEFKQIIRERINIPIRIGGVRENGS